MNKAILIATLALAFSPALAFARPTATPVVRGHNTTVHDHTQPVRNRMVVVNAHR